MQIRPDLGVLSDLRARMNDRGGMQHGRCLDVQHRGVDAEHSRVGDDRKHQLGRARELTVDGRFAR